MPLRERASGRAWLWAVPAGAAPGTPAQAVELGAGAAEDWLFETDVEAWDAERVGPEWRIRAIDEAGRPSADESRIPREPVEKLARRLGARRLTMVALGRGQDWGGRLVLVDARPEGPAEESLRFAQRLVRELGGVVQSRLPPGAPALAHRSHGAGPGRAGAARRHDPVARGGGDGGGRAASPRRPGGAPARRRPRAGAGPAAQRGARAARHDAAAQADRDHAGRAGGLPGRGRGALRAGHRHPGDLRLRGRGRGPAGPRLPRDRPHRPGGPPERAQAQRRAERRSSASGARPRAGGSWWTTTDRASPSRAP